MRLVLKQRERKALIYALIIGSLLVVAAYSGVFSFAIAGAGKGYWVTSNALTDICTSGTACQKGYLSTAIVSSWNPDVIMFSTNTVTGQPSPRYTVDFSMQSESCNWATKYDTTLPLYKWYAVEIHRGATYWGGDQAQAEKDGQNWCTDNWDSSDVKDALNDAYSTDVDYTGTLTGKKPNVIIGDTFNYGLWDASWLCVYGYQVGTMGALESPFITAAAAVTMTPVEASAPSKASVPVSLTYNGKPNKVIVPGVGTAAIITSNANRCMPPSDLKVYVNTLGTSIWGLTQSTYVTQYTIVGDADNLKSYIYADLRNREYDATFASVADYGKRTQTYLADSPNKRLRQIFQGYSSSGSYSVSANGVNAGLLSYSSNNMLADLTIQFEVYASWVGVLQAQGKPQLTCPVSTVGSTGATHEASFVVTNLGPGFGVASVDFTCTGVAASTGFGGTTDWLAQGARQTVGVGYRCQTGETSATSSCTAVATGGAGDKSAPCTFNIDCKGFVACSGAPRKCVGNEVMGCDYDTGAYSEHITTCAEGEICQDGACVNTPGGNPGEQGCDTSGPLGQIMSEVGFTTCGTMDVIWFVLCIIFILFVIFFLAQFI